MPSLFSFVQLLLVASVYTTGTFASPRAQAGASPSQNAPAPTGDSPAAAQAASEAGAAATAASEAQQASAAASSDAAYFSTAARASGTDFYAPPAAQTGPDECGPTPADPSVIDSCGSVVEKVNGPAAYGVQCLRDARGGSLNVTSCAQLIPVMCQNQWQHAGEWVWASQTGCSLGSYLPPDTVQGRAKWPERANCELLIYGAMLHACTDDGATYNYAAVNLKGLPTDQTSGEQVNVGYPSYLIAQNQPRNVGENNSPTPVQIDVQAKLNEQNSAISQAFATAKAQLSTAAAVATDTEAKEALSDLVSIESYYATATDYGYGS